jgi:hypothetical protein
MQLSVMKYQKYFEVEVPKLIENLKSSNQPKFGLMSAQHMVEHLIWVTKSSVKDMGPAPDEFTKGELGFLKFIRNGANFEYRPSDKTEQDLPDLKYGSLSEAKENMPDAILRMKGAIDKKVVEKSSFYNPMMGKLSTDDMALFHFKHFKWHLEDQFQLSLNK